MDSKTTDAILSFWFKDCATKPAKVKPMKRQWYRGSANLDVIITSRFAKTHAEVVATSPTLRQFSPRACLAEIITLDQFSRHMFRGTADAFRFDHLAQALAVELCLQLEQTTLTPIETVFALHPLHHAESNHLQTMGCELLASLFQDLNEQWRDALSGFLQSFEEHALIIRRFGRFPHRNQSIGRMTTPSEQAYLQTNSKGYGQ